MVTQDGLGLCGEKGFRSARLNVPVREGKWYMEVRIEKGGGDDADSGREGAHVRLGWGRREAQLNGPAGLDGYSYAYRDKTGDKVTVSRPRPYGRPFKTGDVIGMYISLPSKRKPKANDPYDPAHIRRERIAIDFKGQEYFECVEYSQSKEMLALMDENNKSKSTASVPSSSKKSATVKNLPERGRQAKATPEPTPLQPLPTLKNSKIGFFVNGECQGVAFEDVFDYLQLRTVPSKRKNQNKRKREGIRTHTDNPFDDGWLGYYPFISLFNGAEVTLNPGPDFEHPPPDDIDCLMEDKKVKGDHSRKWRPLSERYAEFMAEQWALERSGGRGNPGRVIAASWSSRRGRARRCDGGGLGEGVQDACAEGKADPRILESRKLQWRGSQGHHSQVHPHHNKGQPLPSLHPAQQERPQQARAQLRLRSRPHPSIRPLNGGRVQGGGAARTEADCRAEAARTEGRGGAGCESREGAGGRRDYRRGAA